MSEVRSAREEAAAARASLARVQEQAAGWEEALAAKEREAANLQVRERPSAMQFNQRCVGWGTCILWYTHTLESRLFFTEKRKPLHCMQTLAPIPPIDFLPRPFQVPISPLPSSSHQAALGEMSYESDAAERLRLEVRTVTAKWARLQVHQGFKPRVHPRVHQGEGGHLRVMQNAIMLSAYQQQLLFLVRLVGAAPATFKCRIWFALHFMISFVLKGSI